MKKYLNILAIVVLILLGGVFFYRTVLFGRLPVPADALVGIYHPWRDSFALDYPRGVPFKNFLITDPVRQQIPWRKGAIDQMKAGKMPYWNPYNFSGTPLLANIQTGALYPLNFIFFLFSFPAAWSLLIFLEMPLSGIFCYLLLRHYKIHPAFSLFGSLAWSYSGFMVAWLEWGTIVHVVLWLPLILLSCDLMLESIDTGALRKTWICLGLYSVVLIMQLLAGHIQISFYVVSLSIAYACARLILLKDKKKKIEAGLFILLGFGIMAIVTSVQWVPFLSLVNQSARSADSSGWLQPGWFIPWQNLIQFIVPDFFGNPATMNYWGVWNYAEFIGYIGMAPLLFALYAIFSRKDYQTKFFFWVIVFCLVVALPNPVSSLPFILRIPFLSVMQPSRLISLIDISLAILAALGIDQYYKTKRNVLYPIVCIALILSGLWFVVLLRGHLFSDQQMLNNLIVSERNLLLPTVYFLFVSFILLALKNVKNGTWEKIGILLICCITIVDLFRFGWKFLPYTDSRYFFPETAVTNFLKNAETGNPTKPFRIVSVDERVLPPNVETYYDIESVNGYDPIFLLRYNDFVSALEHGKIIQTDFNRILTIHNYASPLLSLLNVRYAISLNEINSPMLHEVTKEGDTRVYEFASYFPRVFQIPSVVARPKDQILPSMLLPEFDPKTTALIEDASFPHIDAASPTDIVSVHDYTGDTLDFSVQGVSDSFIFISQIYYPTWHATIDGKPAKIYATDYIFQGVFVPSGNHDIKLTNSQGV